MEAKKKKNEGRTVPIALKKLRGTFRKDRDLSKPDVAPSQSLPVCPDDYNKAQKEMWYTICQTLFSVGILQDIGWHMIDVYCRQYQLFTDSLKDIKDTGGVITSYSASGGEVNKMHPSVSVMERSFSIMTNIADRFGFSPLSQSRLKHIANGGDGKEKEKGDGFNF